MFSEDGEIADLIYSVFTSGDRGSNALFSRLRASVSDWRGGKVVRVGLDGREALFST